MIKLRQQGVTLIELVIVMIVTSILAIPFANGFLSTSKTIMLNHEVNQANNLAKSCSENLLYKRKSDYTVGTDILISDCSIIPGFSTNGTITINLFSGAAPCPATSTDCAELTISANNNSTQSRAEIILLFVF